MPGERGGFSSRPVGQEKLAAFSGAGLPGAAGGNGERREHRQQPRLDRPLNLVGNIRALVAEARANWRGIGPFNPAMWLGDNLNSLTESAWHQSQASGAYALPPQERVLEEEKHQFLWGLRAAWYLVAYKEVEGEKNHNIYFAIESYASAYNVQSISLPPLGVRLLDAMAEALDIPHRPGQDSFNIEPLLTGAIDKAMNHQNPMPTVEEVRQAITPKAEQES